MKYQEVIHYGQSADTLLRYFTDPEFLVRKYRDQGATNVRVVAVERGADHFSATVARDVPVEVSLPGFARGLVPPTITLVQTDSWDLRRRQGRLLIDFPGLERVRLTCAMALVDTPDGAREDLAFEIRVDVPLLGGRLEDILARDLRLKFARDTAASHAIIGRREEEATHADA